MIGKIESTITTTYTNLLMMTTQISIQSILVTSYITNLMTNAMIYILQLPLHITAPASPESVIFKTGFKIVLQLYFTNITSLLATTICSISSLLIHYQHFEPFFLPIGHQNCKYVSLLTLSLCQGFLQKYGQNSILNPHYKGY